ncbi:MAG: DNA repair protein RadA, partial [Acidimicrobiia bacterium]|nr:DNA repair protein RadA [Acidimicrobiia bacterium]
AGGVRIEEPAADLAIALAVHSALIGTAVPPDLAVCGEVGLGGEVRSVAHIARRLAEAQRLGFTRALVPPSTPDGPSGLRVLRVPTLAAAFASVATSATTAAAMEG